MVAYEAIQLQCQELPLQFDFIDEQQQQTVTQDTVTQDTSIETAQQFFKWFSNIEAEMERGREGVYRANLDTVVLYKDTTHSILSAMVHTNSLLDNLDKNYTFVEKKSVALQQACESLLDEQTNLATLSIQLSSKLAYFNQLEPITKLLSAPGDLVCLDPQFIPVLSKLDHCLAFLNQHIYYLDSELYNTRFRQCLTRALTLIKIHFCNQMRVVTQESREKLRDKAPKEILPASLYASLFYLRFRTHAAKLSTLIQEIESRCESHQEYLSLLLDCTTSYHICRKQILTAQIESNIASLVESTPDLLTFLRSGCAYMIGVCHDEYTLFTQFFNHPSTLDQTSLFLTDLAESLYTALRPQILRITRIETLTEICQQLIIHMHDSHILGDDGQVIAGQSVVECILQDAQQRLVFRAQAYLRTEIEGFKIRDEEVLLFARTGALPGPRDVEGRVPMSAVLSDVTDGLNESWRPSVMEAMEGDDSIVEIASHVYGGGEWYPTLERTNFILGKLYNSVPPGVFEDLSQEAVEICRVSLVGAAEVISSKQTKLDGQLFLIKNLLMLREQIGRYEGNFVRKEDSIDLSGLTDVLSSLVQNKWSSIVSLGLSFLAASTPKVVLRYSDSKAAVDKELKRVCEDLILENAKAALEPVSSFLLKVSAFRLRNEARNLQNKELLIRQSFAQNASAAFRKTLADRFMQTIDKMKSYLGDRKTEIVLIKVIKSHILDTYQTFFDLVSSNYEFSIVSQVMTVSQVSVFMGED